MGGRGASTYSTRPPGSREPDLDSEYADWEDLAYPPRQNPTYWSREAREAFAAENPDWESPDPGDFHGWTDHDYESWEWRFPGWFEEHGLENPNPPPEPPPLYVPVPIDAEDWQAFQDAIRSAADSEEISQVLRDFVESRMSDPQPLEHPRLPEPEELATVALRNTLVHLPPVITPSVEHLLLDLVIRAFPPRVQRFIQEVIITEQVPEPPPAAAPPAQRVTEPFIINADPVENPPATWLEDAAAARLALWLWGNLTPPLFSLFRAALNSGEPPINPAAATSPAADFAQSVIQYLLNPATLYAIARKRFDAIARIMADLNSLG